MQTAIPYSTYPGQQFGVPNYAPHPQMQGHYDPRTSIPRHLPQHNMYDPNSRPIYQ